MSNHQANRCERARDTLSLAATHTLNSAWHFGLSFCRWQFPCLPGGWTTTNETDISFNVQMLHLIIVVVFADPLGTLRVPKSLLSVIIRKWVPTFESENSQQIQDSEFWEVKKKLKCGACYQMKWTRTSNLLPYCVSRCQRQSAIRHFWLSSSHRWTWNNLYCCAVCSGCAVTKMVVVCTPSFLLVESREACMVRRAGLFIVGCSILILRHSSGLIFSRFLFIVIGA